MDFTTDKKVADIKIKPLNLDTTLYYIPESDLNEISEIEDGSYFDVQFAPGRFVLINNQSNEELVNLGETFSGRKLNAGDLLQRIIQDKCIGNERELSTKFTNNQIGSFFQIKIDEFTRQSFEVNGNNYPLRMPTSSGLIQDLDFISKDYAMYSKDENFTVFDSDKDLLTDYEFFAEEVLYDVIDKTQAGEELLYASEDFVYNMQEIIAERESSETINEEITI